MNEAQILSSVCEYLESHRYKLIRLDPKKSPSGIKSPDFEVHLKGKPNFYCEVKSPLLRANEITKMFHWSTSVTKLRDHIHKAVEQFSDHDPQHKLPWVLVFTSDHIQLNWSNMTHAIIGKVYYGEEVIANLTHLKRVKDTVKDVDQIDIFVWMQMNVDTEIHQVRIVINPKMDFGKQVLEIGKKFEPLPTDKSFKR